MSRLVLFVSCFLLVATSCSSTKYVAKKIDTTIDVKGKVDDGYIGLNKKGQAIIQEETEADDELRTQQWENSRLENQLYTDSDRLKRCRNDLSDPRLGGSGSVSPVPSIDDIKSPAELKEEFGIDSEGRLKVVKRSFFVEKLRAERKYARSLKKLIKQVKKHRVECERKMGYARRKQGLPAGRYKAEGHYDARGNWKMTRKGEQTLDDAFEIQAKSRD